MENTFKHNSRSYFDVYNALIQAYPNMPVWMFKEMAGLFDFQSELQNRTATDILYPKTRESAYGFAARCDYSPVEASGATAEIDVTLTGAMAKTISVGYQFGGISTSTGNMVIFEVTTATSSGGGSTVDDIPCTQKTSFTDVNVGQVDNQDDFMNYPFTGYTNIIKDSVTLTINSLTWTRVDNFDSSISTDRHFRLIYQSSGKVRFEFGDGVTGLKPTLNETIYASFSTTNGLLGKMDASTIIINVGGDADISSLINVAGTSGGADPESIASIIRNSRANARLRNIVWSKEDLEIAAKQSSSSVVHALGVPGSGTATIHIIPSGGGAAGGALQTIVDDYVTALTQFGSMPIVVQDTTYVIVNISANVTIRSGFVTATVLDLVEFAMTLTSCAYDIEVVEYYDDNGIDACRTNVINSLWAWAFTSSENDALESIILRWKDLLGSYSNRQYGQYLEVGDLWIMGNDLYDYGVDVFSLTAPTVNQPTSSTQIIDTGTLTIT